MLGPAPQTLARLRGQYRWHVLLKGGRAGALRAVAAQMLDAFESARGPRTVRVVADVDPVEVL